jgi:phi13 family phage major tail protein
VYRINIKNFHWAKLTKDDSTGVTYDTIKAIPGLMSIKMAPTLASGKLYGDGIIRRQTDKIESIAVEFETNKIPIEDRAAMQGQTCANGVIEVSESDEAPYIAIGYEIEGDESSSEFVWLYKGKMAPLEESVQQKTDKLAYQSQTAKMTFIPRENDRKLFKLADSDGTGYVETTGTSWFNAVPAPAGA